MNKKNLVIIAVSTVLLASCGGNNEEANIKLTVWEDPNNHEMLQDVADQFIATYQTNYPEAPTLEIEFIQQTEGAAMDDLSLQGPSGNGPDIFSFVHDTLSSGVTNELVRPIENKEFVDTHFSEASIKAFTLDDMLYAYPITAESQVLMYDKTKLSALEVSSWENIHGSGEAVVMDVANSDSSAYYMFGFMNDVNLFGDGTNKNILDIDTPNTVKNLTEMASNYKSAIQNGTPDQALTIMELGEAAGVISSPYLWETFKSELGEDAALAVLPTLNGEELRPFSGYKGYGVSRYSEHPHLANALAKHMTDAIAQEVRFARKTLLPTYLDSVSLNQRLEDDEDAVVFQTSLEQSLTMPNIIAMSSYWADMNDAVTSIWNLGENATETQVKEILTAAEASIKNKIS